MLQEVLYSPAPVRVRGQPFEGSYNCTGTEDEIKWFDAVKLVIMCCTAHRAAVRY